jgi:glycosyltransferase involved in cell wall biosynthesis
LLAMGRAARQRFLRDFERNAVGKRLLAFLLDRMSSHVTQLSARPVVLVMQRRIMHYRVALYERLRVALDQCGVELRLAYSSTPLKKVANNKDEGILPWATPVPGRDILTNALCWQDVRCAMDGVKLAVLMQENRMLWNYVMPVLYPRTRWAFYGHGKNFGAEGVVAVGEYFKKWYLRHAHWFFAYTDISCQVVQAAGFPRERISILNNSIDTAELEADLASISDAELFERRTQWGMGKGPVGLVLGTLYGPKRLAMILKAADAIRTRIPDFELLVVGDGLQRDMVVQAAAQSGGWIHWVGALKGREKAFALRCAQVLLNPGMVGLVMIDSLVAGVPVLTCALPNHSPEIAYLKSGQNGLIVADSLDAFTQEAVMLLQDDERRLTMVQACREDATLYSLDNMVQRYRDGILSCLHTAEMTPEKLPAYVSEGERLGR